jgi:protein-disulfide isomerase
MTARHKRMTQLAALAVLSALIVVAVLIAISQSGSDDSAGSGATTAADELSGLDQSGTVLGDPDAPVRIAEFGDLQCPVCARFASDVIPGLIENEVRPGDATLEFKNFTIIGPDSVTAAKASLAAAEQGRYWEFIDLFYANQGAENSGYVTDAFLDGIASHAGVEDIKRFNSDRHAARLDAELAKVQGEASKVGFNATPSFLVEGPGGRRTLTAPSLEQLEAAVDQVSG